MGSTESSRREFPRRMGSGAARMRAPASMTQNVRSHTLHRVTVNGELVDAATIATMPR